MTDIEKLIERLKSEAPLLWSERQAAADALTRMVPPLPAEVAEAVGSLRLDETPDLDRAARMLESLARENARLAAENAELRADAETHEKAIDIVVKREDDLQWKAHENGKAEMQPEIDRLRAELETANKESARFTLAVSRALGSLGQGNDGAQMLGHPHCEVCIEELEAAFGPVQKDVLDQLDAKKGG